MRDIFGSSPVQIEESEVRYAQRRDNFHKVRSFVLFLLLAVPSRAFADPVEVKPNASAPTSSSSTCESSSVPSHAPAQESEEGEPSQVDDTELLPETSFSNTQVAPVPGAGFLQLSLGLRLSSFGGGESTAAHFDQSYNIAVDERELSRVPMLVVGADYNRGVGRYLFWGLGAAIGFGLPYALDTQVPTSGGMMDVRARAFQYQAQASFGIELPISSSSRLSFWINGGVTVDSIRVETILFNCIEEDVFVRARPLARLNASWTYNGSRRSSTGFGIYAAFDIGNLSPEVGIRMSLGRPPTK